MSEEKKICFFVAPIGDEGTATRERSDDVRDYIVKPVVEACGYGEPIRADQIGRQGIISTQIIEHLLVDDMVVADLTDSNANVLYELAIRAGRLIVH